MHAHTYIYIYIHTHIITYILITKIQVKEVLLFMRKLLNMYFLIHFSGYDNFKEDVELMLGFKISIFWKIAWCYVSPIVLIVSPLLSFTLQWGGQQAANKQGSGVDLSILILDRI